MFGGYNITIAASLSVDVACLTLFCKKLFKVCKLFADKKKLLGDSTFLKYRY